MARRKKELGIFEMLMELPWWGGATFAVVSYIFIGIILPNKWAAEPNAKWFIGFCPPFAKMAAFAGLLAASVSAIRSLKDRPPSVGRRTIAYLPSMWGQNGPASGWERSDTRQRVLGLSFLSTLSLDIPAEEGCRVRCGRPRSHDIPLMVMETIRRGGAPGNLSGSFSRHNMLNTSKLYNFVK